MTRDIRALDAEADCTHDANGDPSFAEGSLIVWHDLKSGVGGVWSMSQEPVKKLTHSCFGVFATSDGLRFRQNVQRLPMQPGDRGPGHMSVGTGLRLDLADMSINANLPECEAELVFKDFHPRYDYRQLMGISTCDGHSAQHVEVAGSVKGKLRIGTREFEIDALAHRRRTWGPRYWDTLLSTRWVPMVFGPDLSIHLQSLIYRNGKNHRCMGYAIRNGIPILMTEPGIAVTLDYDSAGPKSGRIKFGLESGDVLDLQHQRSSDVFLDIAGLLAIESIGTVKFANRIGMSNIEVCANPFGGDGIPGVPVEADSVGESA